MSDTRPAPDTLEELIWLRGYEAGVIQCRADQSKASEAIQDARRSSIQSLIQKGIELDEEMRALQARCDELEAAARDLLDNAEPKWGDKVVVHRSVIQALRSVVDGGSDG